jgi:hypothetical protein
VAGQRVEFKITVLAGIVAVSATIPARTAITEWTPTPFQYQVRRP